MRLAACKRWKILPTFRCSDIFMIFSYQGSGYWRTSTGLEVDLIVGELDLAVEFKARARVDERDTQGLRALLADQRVKRAVVVSLDTAKRRLSPGITVYPWRAFCQELWAGAFDP